MCSELAFSSTKRFIFYKEYRRTKQNDQPEMHDK
jgi:hypothetical protein